MGRRFRVWLVLAAVACAAPALGAYTEFYCNASTGSNTNAGSTTGSPAFTSTSCSWVSATGVCTVNVADQPVSGVSAGDFAAVYRNGGTVAALVGRVTSTTSSTITISTTAKSGSLTDGTGDTTIKVGGAWQGPNGTSGFPFGFITNALTSATTTSYPRVNLKNNATYSVTAAVSSGNNGPLVFQGYTSTVGDGGRFTLDGGTSGASYALLTLTHNTWLADAIIQKNGATGSATGLTMNGNASLATRVTVQNVRGNGIEYTGGQGVFDRCEASGCNQSNTAAKGGFYTSQVASLTHCYSHDNAGSNSSGFLILGLQSHVANCVADTNGSKGFYFSMGHAGRAAHCDAYNNGSDGFFIDQAANCFGVYENCNAVKNGGWGFNNNNSGVKYGLIRNCGFGSGSQANTSGTINAGANLSLTEVGTITYASGATPWNDPANGDFTVTLGAAKAAGYGAFLGTTNTTGYPDLGAAQSRGGGISRARDVNQ